MKGGCIFFDTKGLEVHQTLFHRPDERPSNCAAAESSFLIELTKPAITHTELTIQRILLKKEPQPFG